MIDLDRRLRAAVDHFWRTRAQQAKHQGATTGVRDAGLRSAVTAGKHMDGFIRLCRDLLIEAGVPQDALFVDKAIELPGYFRAEKRWDLLVVWNQRLVAAIEFKAQVGPSFGNNFNNRVEEAVGSATDLWAAYREGAFQPSQRPWLGYLFLLEEHSRSCSPVAVKEPHYPVFPEFRNASYVGRYQWMLTRLVRERLYDAACFLTSPQPARTGQRVEYRQLSEELAFSRFAAALRARAAEFSGFPSRERE